LVLSSSYRLFGNNIYVERTIGLIYRLLILLGIVAIAHRFDIFLTVACGLIAVILLARTDLFANACFAATGFALIGMSLVDKRYSPWLCSVGACLLVLLFCVAVTSDRRQQLDCYR